MFKYRVIALGGTFDLLHKGHEYFISEAFDKGKKVIIGLTSDKYVEGVKSLLRGGSKHKRRDSSDGGTMGWISPIRPYQDRKKELAAFLRQKHLLSRAQIIKIDDIYGPAVDDKKIEAILVTQKTESGAEKINKKRKEKKLSPLKIIEVPLVCSNDGKIISSSRIRMGEIGRDGLVYKSVSVLDKISDQLRQKLKKPQGYLLIGDPEKHKRVKKDIENLIFKAQPIMVITVGDEVTKLLKKHLIEPSLSVIDFKVAREEKYSSLAELGFKKNFQFSIFNFQLVRNPPGHITKTLVSAVDQAIKDFITSGQNQIIKVIGEEDLSGVPSILLAPLGSVVLYGQPGKGVVVVEVIEEEKRRLVRLIESGVSG